GDGPAAQDAGVVGAAAALLRLGGDAGGGGPEGVHHDPLDDGQVGVEEGGAVGVALRQAVAVEAQAEAAVAELAQKQLQGRLAGAAGADAGELVGAGAVGDGDDGPFAGGLDGEPVVAVGALVLVLLAADAGGEQLAAVGAAQPLRRRLRGGVRLVGGPRAVIP